jgi:putative ABC transport system permease protein
MRSAVVVSQVTLCFVLLVGSGLMVRSFIAIQRADLGFNPLNVMTFLVPSVRASGTDGRAGAVRSIRERLLAIPGVAAVTAADPLPLDGGGRLYRYGPEESLADNSQFRQGTFSVVQPGYFEAMGTRVIEGRTFTEADNESSPMVVVIDETMAARMFPGRSAVGQRILARWRSADMLPFEVVGVVQHQRFISASANGPEQFFMADAFMGGGRANRWAVRTIGNPANLVPQIRRAIAGVDPAIAIFEMAPYGAYVDRARAQAKFALILMLLFAGVTVVLTVVGLYGVISTAARQRTAEIGLRVAIGASGSDIVRLIVGYGLRLSAAGIVLGLGAAVFMTRLLASQLVDVTPTDPTTFAATIAGFLALALLACGVPALRASRLDPVAALREE